MDAARRSRPRGGGVVLALTLAGVAGFVDAVGFIVLRGLFTAHMSGNAAQVGVRLGHGDAAAAVPLLAAIVLFVIGVGLGAAVEEVAARRRIASRTALTLALQAAVVAAFMLYGEARIGAGRVADHGLGGFYVLAALAIVAMGIQAASIRRVGGQAVRTTYITGVLTDFSRGAVQRLARGSRADTAVGLLGGVVVLYLAGATLGSIAQDAAGMWSLAVPLAALLLASLADVRRPFATVE
jgi:uncharacterized membrane protein YoaK (UPF0700 family)